jgi:hypothetical protein
MDAEEKEPRALLCARTTPCLPQGEFPTWPMTHHPTSAECIEVVDTNMGPRTEGVRPQLHTSLDSHPISHTLSLLRPMAHVWDKENTSNTRLHRTRGAMDLNILCECTRFSTLAPVVLQSSQNSHCPGVMCSNSAMEK